MLSRRFLAGFGSMALAAAFAHNAFADTPFTTFSFAAASSAGGATRTMPDRISDDFNIKDFGALGTGAFDCRTALQAAINAAGSSVTGRGKVVVPLGTFLISAGVACNTAGEVSIIIEGKGAGSIIRGDFNDYLITRNDTGGPANGGITIRNLQFANNHATGGCVYLLSPIGGTVEGVVFGGSKCLYFSGQSNVCSACSFGTNSTSGEFGVYLGANCTMLGGDITGFQKGAILANTGPVISGTRFEVNVVAITLGVSGGGPGETFCSGFCVFGGSMESNGVGIDFAAGPGHGLIGGLAIAGNVGAAPYAANGTVVPDTTLTGVTSGATCMGSIAANGVATFGTVTGTFMLGEFITGTGVPTDTGLFVQLSGGVAGKAGTYGLRTAAVWGIRMNNKAHHVVFSGVNVGGAYSQASIQVAGQSGGGHDGLVFEGCSVTNGGTPAAGEPFVAWDLTGSNAGQASWNNCCDGNGVLFMPQWTFSQLPTVGLAAGEFHWITNANTASWGVAVTAGGAPNTKGYVVWNGTAWTLMSK